MKISFGVTFLPSLFLNPHRRAYVYVPPAPTPWLAAVIRGLLTRRVAPAPARRSLTLESNPGSSSCVSLSRDARRPVAAGLPPSTEEGFYRPIVALAASPSITRNPVRRRERYWRRSLTTLPLLAWQPSRVAPCICLLYVAATYIRAPFHAPWRRRRRRRRHARGREIATTRLQPRFNPARSVTPGDESLKRKPQCYQCIGQSSFREDSAPGLGTARRDYTADAVKAFRSDNRARRESLCRMCRAATPNATSLYYPPSGVDSRDLKSARSISRTAVFRSPRPLPDRRQPLRSSRFLERISISRFPRVYLAATFGSPGI